jgi:hypothetical protein
VWRLAGTIAVMAATAEFAAWPATAFPLFLVFAVLSPLPFDLAAPVVVLDLSLPASRMITPTPVAVPMALPIPMPGMLALTAAMATFILPGVSFCYSKRCREYQS